MSDWLDKTMSNNETCSHPSWYPTPIDLTITTELIFCSFNRKRHQRVIIRYDSTAIDKRQLVENVRLEEVFEERAGEKKRVWRARRHVGNASNHFTARQSRSLTYGNSLVRVRIKSSNGERTLPSCVQHRLLMRESFERNKNFQRNDKSASYNFLDLFCVTLSNQWRIIKNYHCRTRSQHESTFSEICIKLHEIKKPVLRTSCEIYYIPRY